MTFPSDTLVDTDGTNLSSHTPTGPNAGTSWTDAYGVASGIKIYGNRASLATGGFAHIQKVLNASGGYTGDDYDVDAIFTFYTDAGAANWYSIIARGSSTDRICYELCYNASTDVGWTLRYNDGATRNLLGSQAYAFPSFGTTKAAKLRVSAASVSAYIDDALIIGPITDANLTTGKAGLYMVGDTPYAAASLGVEIGPITVSALGAPTFLDIPHSARWQSVIVQ